MWCPDLNICGRPCDGSPGRADPEGDSSRGPEAARGRGGVEGAAPADRSCSQDGDAVDNCKQLALVEHNRCNLKTKTKYSLIPQTKKTCGIKH